MRTEEQMLKTIANWVYNTDFVRAIILTSSRANPNAQLDFLSDYDIEMYVNDINIIKQNDIWLEPLGNIMSKWPHTPSHLAVCNRDGKMIKKSLT